jgi:alpha-D-ribose 1-methylphosphonate 5-triphosphate diphosphatase
MHNHEPNALTIIGGRVLTVRGLEDGISLTIEDEHIAPSTAGGRIWDASGLLVLPGIIDLHGDAFERQLMPRPGVRVAPEVALLDTDRQLAANGITTAFHAMTWSWEPGLRGRDMAHAFVAALDRVRVSLAVDTKLHLRWETFNLIDVPEIAMWLVEGRVGLFAFNDHTLEIVRCETPAKLLRFVERTSLPVDDFRSLAQRVWERRDAVPAAIEKLARVAREHNIPLASHDDDTPSTRLYFRQMGSAISEFPKTLETARAARDHGEHVVMGAPNVMRGGSHLSAVSASALVREGLCTVLSSDYYYPAMVAAAFRLAREGTATFDAAWRLISTNAAAAAGLVDRGALDVGQRADIVVVDDRVPALPRVVATFVAGRPVFVAREAAKLVA